MILKPALDDPPGRRNLYKPVNAMKNVPRQDLVFVDVVLADTYIHGGQIADQQGVDEDEGPRTYSTKEVLPQRICIDH